MFDFVFSTRKKTVSNSNGVNSNDIFSEFYYDSAEFQTPTE